MQVACLLWQRVCSEKFPSRTSLSGGFGKEAFLCVPLLLGSKRAVSPKCDTGGEVKKWEKYHKIGHFSLLSGEYQPPLVLEKNRTSLRKSTSPPVSSVAMSQKPS